MSAEVLTATPNQFGGVIIAPEALPDDPAEFRARLRASVSAWKDEGRKVAWLEAPLAKAALIPAATEAGFIFHHATPAYLMLTLRLAEDAFIPEYATHFIGAGGVVLNSRRELLVVCERHRLRSRPYYKLPGGALQPGEHLSDAVVREVLEETGVRTRFEALVCLRHWHGYRYGKSDIYFVCRLSALSEELTMQAEEIEECLWMPVDEYLDHELVSLFNRRIVETALATPGLGLCEIDGYGDLARYEFFMPGSAPA